MSLKKFLITALCAVCAASLLVPAAFAHGGCRSRWNSSVNTQTTPYRCAVCTVPGCELTGRHYHNGVLYCGYNHANGWCNGACVPLCPVDGCTQAGRHTHNGVVYCGTNHAAGYCTGSCPSYTQQPSGTWRGCHGWHH